MTLKYGDTIPINECDYVAKLVPRPIKNDTDALVINTDDPPAEELKSQLILASRKDDYESDLEDNFIQTCEPFSKRNTLLRLPIKQTPTGVYYAHSDDVTKVSRYKLDATIDSDYGDTIVNDTGAFLTTSMVGQHNGKFLVLNDDRLIRYNNKKSIDTLFGIKALEAGEFIFKGLRIRPDDSKDVVVHRFSLFPNTLNFYTWSKKGVYRNAVSVVASPGILIGGIPTLINPFLSGILSDGRFIAQQKDERLVYHLVIWNTDGTYNQQIDITIGNTVGHSAAICCTTDGGFLLAYWDGNTILNPIGGTGFHLVKYDSSGSQVYDTSLGTLSGFSLIHSAVMDIAVYPTTGDILVTIYHDPTGAGGGLVRFLTFDSLGSLTNTDSTTIAYDIDSFAVAV